MERGTARRLWLLRHAKSSWDDPAVPDEDRPLAPRGELAAAAMAAHLAAAGVRPDLVLCSAALRARQTLGAVFASLGGALEIRVEPELYTFDAGVLLARLRQIDDAVRSVMLVGHNPAMQDLGLRLTGSGADRARLETKLPTGALVAIVVPDPGWSVLADGACALEGLVTPRDILPPDP